MQILEKSPAPVVIIEGNDEDMSSLDIAESIRDIDLKINHFTHIIMVRPDASVDLTMAFSETIDALIIDRKHALQGAVLAGCRIANQINALSDMNGRLTNENLALQESQLQDDLTGLGNKRYAEQNLADAIRQIESRSGAVCFLMISVNNYSEVMEQYAEKVADEMIKLIADKIKHLVRPMDVVTYFDKGKFALILLQPSINNCTAECFQRVYDGVRLKSYSTSAGFLSADISMSICAGNAENNPPNADQMIESAINNLEESMIQQSIVVQHLDN